MSAKARLKSLLIGAARGIERAPQRDPGVLVTMYHEIRDDGAPYSVSAETFAAQLDYLQDAGTQFLGAAACGDRLRAGEAGDAVCITFDDAHANAFDALARAAARGATSTLFVITERVGQAGTMDWTQLGELADAGVEIGSHSVSHRSLPTLSAEALREELHASKACLEQRLGRAVETVAYPYGHFDPAVLQASEDAGYACGFTAEHLYATPPDAPFRIPRFEPETVPELRALHRGEAHHFYRWLGAWQRRRESVGAA